MGDKSNISYVHHTSSPWFGCSKVDPLCSHCYAEALTLRNKWAGWGDNSPRVRSKGFWKDVYKWDKAAAAAGERRRTFTSLMDWLDDKAPIEWLRDFLEVIYRTPNLDHLLLTKRPELFSERLHAALALPSENNFSSWLSGWLDGFAPANVWFGYSAGTRKEWIERHRISYGIPSRVTWCSAEPLLEPLLVSDLLQDEEVRNSHNLDWLVIGGESGRHLRDPGVGAIINLAASAKACACKVFVKQDVSRLPGQQGRIPAETWVIKEFPK